MTRTSDVVIVGGGVFGVTAALSLRARGCAVALVDPGPLPHPDASSTDISKCVRADYGSDAFYTEQMEAALPRWRAWNERWPEPLYFETGVCFLTSGPMREGSFELESYRQLTARGFALQRLADGAVSDRFSAWRGEAFTDGYYNPQGGWAKSGAVVATLARDAVDAGVALHSERAIAVGDGEVTTDRGRLSAAVVVVAAGAWTSTLVPAFSACARVVGQPVLCVAPADPAPFTAPRFTPFGADISRTGLYGFCANDGIVKVAHHGPGAALEASAPRVMPDDAEPRFRSFFADALPALLDAPTVAQRVCLYCDSLDGDLWIDRVPGHERLVVAAGGSGHAFKLAPLLGGWIADVAGGGAPLDRFAWRGVERPRFEQARHTG